MAQYALRTAGWLAQPVPLWQANPACAEDRATLESDPSAGTGTVHGAGRPALPRRPPTLHRLKGDKLMRWLPACLALGGVAPATAPQTHVA